MSIETESRLGQFLRDRRGRLDPAALGFAVGRRRTPGLRREEVAHRSNISPTWYTWLEQGRGGAPSADVLERIAGGLMLTGAEREHLFMLGLRSATIHRQASRRACSGCSMRSRRVPGARQDRDLEQGGDHRADRLRQAAARKGNILRMLFNEPHIRAAQHDWEGVARFVVGAFRADAARAGAVSEVAELVDELRKSSADFDALWRDNDVHAQARGSND